MKFVLAFAVCATAANIGQAVKNIPSCAFDALKDALQTDHCDTNNVNGDLFDCWCGHTGSILSLMSGHIDSQCLIDYGDPYGQICGAWLASSTKASGWAEATSALASELGVKATGGSASKTTTGTSDATGKASSGDATSTSSDDAAAPTAMPKVLGWVGGAAAAIVPMIL